MSRVGAITRLVSLAFSAVALFVVNGRDVIGGNLRGAVREIGQ